MSEFRLRSFAISSSSSEMAANVQLLRRLSQHGFGNIDWLPSRREIVDGGTLSSTELSSWLDQVLPSLVEIVEVMHTLSRNYFTYKIMETKVDLVLALTDKHRYYLLLSEMMSSLVDSERYGDATTADFGSLEYWRSEAEEIAEDAEYLQEFCWWLYQQLARKAEFRLVEYVFMVPAHTKRWLSEADLAYTIKTPRWWNPREYKSYRIWRQYNKYQKLQREKAEFDEM